MITKLDIKKDFTKTERLFKRSYAIEGNLLGVPNFPPMQRTINSFKNSKNLFYGFYDDMELAGAIEMKKLSKGWLIQSLVVDPNHFRKGMASKMIKFILDEFKLPLFVETGKANLPACSLYKKNSFTLIDSYEADMGIMKVRFEMQ